MALAGGKTDLWFASRRWVARPIYGLQAGDG